MTPEIFEVIGTMLSGHRIHIRTCCERDAIWKLRVWGGKTLSREQHSDMPRTCDEHQDNKLKDRVVAALEASNKLDTESGHKDADNALCEFLIGLGYEDVVELWDQEGKWYS